MSKPIVAFVVDELPVGGISRVAIDYANLLTRRGYPVQLIMLGDANECMLTQLDRSVTKYYIPFSSYLAPERYCSLVKRAWWGRFVYPFIYVLLSVYMWIRLPFLRLRLPKTDVAIAFAGHYADLTVVGDVYSSKVRKVAWLHGVLSSYAIISCGFVNLYKKMDELVSLGDEGNSEFFLSHPYLNFSIRTIYNPVCLNIDAGRNSVGRAKQDESPSPTIVMVSRLIYPQKDHLTLLKAVKLLIQGAQPDLRLRIVGDGPDRQMIEDYAQDLGLGSHVEFIGEVLDCSPYYLSADVSVLSSPAEGLPTVLLESMALGVPVVATDARTGVREILGDSQYGLICEVANPVDLADKINRLLTDKDLQTKYQSMGYKRIEDFKEDVVATKIDALLLDLVNRKFR